MLFTHIINYIFRHTTVTFTERMSMERELSSHTVTQSRDSLSRTQVKHILVEQSK